MRCLFPIVFLHSLAFGFLVLTVFGFLYFVFSQREDLTWGFFAYGGFFAFLVLAEGLDLYFWKERVVTGPVPLTVESIEALFQFSLGFFVLALLFDRVRLSRERKRKRKATQQLQDSLREKKTLLREVHHRVKNNLQVVLSLIGLQKNQVDSPQTEKHLDRIRSRIESMALVHENLDQNVKQGTIQTDRYLGTLIDNLSSMHNLSDDVKVKHNLESIELEPERLIPCGMVLSELVSNACEHAFDEGGSGRIDVRVFSRSGEEVVLHVRDDGAGGLTEEQLRESESLGLRLIRNLVQNQLRGKLSVESNGGTTVEVHFPAPVEVDSSGGPG